jgi:CRISPR-associated protein Cas1
MYERRFGQSLPHRDINVLRGIEGARVRESYVEVAKRFDVPWQGRKYDRANPANADIPNQAINHASTFVEAAAEVAVAAVGALPPLGFIHEDSSKAFTLDVADLWRSKLTLPLAFDIARQIMDNPSLKLEREIRHEAARTFKKQHVIPNMIDAIKELVSCDHDNCDA